MQFTESALALMGSERARREERYDAKMDQLRREEEREDERHEAKMEARAARKLAPKLNNWPSKRPLRWILLRHRAVIKGSRRYGIDFTDYNIKFNVLKLFVWKKFFSLFLCYFM